MTISGQILLLLLMFGNILSPISLLKPYEMISRLRKGIHAAGFKTTEYLLPGSAQTGIREKTSVFAGENHANSRIKEQGNA